MSSSTNHTSRVSPNSDVTLIVTNRGGRLVDFEAARLDIDRGFSTDKVNSRKYSLLGKPVVLRPTSKRDARYRKFQARVYNFLERPRGCRAASYHVFVLFMVLLCLGLSVFSTIPDYEDGATEILFYIEIILVVMFACEYLLRLWSSGCRSRYQKWHGRLRFVTLPFSIIDFVVIVASTVVLCMGTTGQVFAASAVRGLRFFQILRMVRIDRRGGTWKLLGSVVWAHRQELITTLYIGFLGLIFASFLVYLCEKNEHDDGQFATFADALWWGVTTLCTIGYGDRVPVTWMGKIIASFCALLGISFFALPAGILGSGFALKVQQQQRQKHLIRRRGPAARLIQTMWRLYAADEKSSSVATWKIHLRKKSLEGKGGGSFRSQHPGPAGGIVSRLSRRGGRSPLAKFGNPEDQHTFHKKASQPLLMTPSEESTERVSAELRCSTENLSADEDNNHHGLDRSCIVTSISQITEAHKNAIRFLRRLSFLVARRKFKEALKPYDVKDVIEQYSAGHVDLLARVKNLQQRCDQILGKQGSGAKDVYESKICLAARIVNVERSIADVEQKLDVLMDMFIEERQARTADRHNAQDGYRGGVPPINDPRPVGRERRVDWSLQPVCEKDEKEMIC